LFTGAEVLHGSMADIMPPPGLELPLGFKPAKLEGEKPFASAVGAYDTPVDDIQKHEKRSDVFLPMDKQPLKVKMGAATEVEPWALPQTLDKTGVDVKSAAAPQAKLTMQHDELAKENARLAWENEVLRQQHQHIASAPYSYQDWWMPTDPWAAAQAAMVGLQPGVNVKLHSLKNAAELNGEIAIVAYWHAESGRWAVRLQNQEEKFVKPENLEVQAFGGDIFHPYAGAEQMWPWQWPQDAWGKTKKYNRASTGSFGSEASTRVGSSYDSFGSRKSSDEDDVEDEPEPWTPEKGPRTTIMMRNIPNNYNRANLLELLNKCGFDKSCDLIYLPIDFQTEVGLGYAFINLVSETEVTRFKDHFQGFTEWSVASQKVCEISWSNPLQGLQAHIDRYRNSPVMHESVPDEHKPMLFSDGIRKSFPEPTKKIRAPRLRRGMRHASAAKQGGAKTIIEQP
jgi:hypothetical protein